jgi:hypothetical protein
MIGSVQSLFDLLFFVTNILHLESIDRDKVCGKICKKAIQFSCLFRSGGFWMIILFESKINFIYNPVSLLADKQNETVT